MKVLYRDGTWQIEEFGRPIQPSHLCPRIDANRTYWRLTGNPEQCGLCGEKSPKGFVFIYLMKRNMG